MQGEGDGEDYPAEWKTLILEDPRIMEMAFGEYEGKCCSKEGWDVPESFHRFFDDPAGYQPPEGGESFEDVKKENRRISGVSL